jgi:hypothetical protein
MQYLSTNLQGIRECMTNLDGRETHLTSKTGIAQSHKTTGGLL